MQFDPTLTWSALIAFATILFTWYRTRDQRFEDKFQAGSKRMNEQDLRLQRIEQQIEAMPDKDDMHAMQLTLADINGELKAVRSTMRAIAESQNRLETISSRHEDYLRENK
ncbi:DUF2730 domain-containing protein [Rhodobacteraceae bacterium M382]|nr:DUF2730 domain-containing protein [Rhodobacteraceae bacterium M382]